MSKEDFDRVSVNVSPDTAAALRLVMEHEDVSCTEALRRLVGYGDVTYRAIKERGAQVLVREADGRTDQVVLL